MSERAKPRLSACICTCYGAERIEDTLWSVVCQSAPPDSYEVLVVDNGVPDREKLELLIKQLGARDVTVRLVEEPAPGLSHAKNRAVLESRGDYVIFLDDDALANPRWVECFIDEIDEHAPDVVGGHVHPLFEAEPPEELDYSFWGFWSLKHFGAGDRWLDRGEYFLGGNMGARRELLLENPHDPVLGRTGEELVGGEEWYLGHSRFSRRLVAGAFIFHKVPQARFELDYLVARYVAHTPADSLEVQAEKRKGFMSRWVVRDFLALLRRRGLRRMLRHQLERGRSA
jgi:glycosyltransferase involved in cell wall biosynthesis